MPRNWEEHPSVEAVLNHTLKMPDGNDWALATSKAGTPMELKLTSFKWIQKRIDELRELTKLVEAIPNDLK